MSKACVVTAKQTNDLISVLIQRIKPEYTDYVTE